MWGGWQRAAHGGPGERGLEVCVGGGGVVSGEWERGDSRWEGRMKRWGEHRR